ncbi:uncharacterized protein LOC128667240 [Microplitis demolitor]|uniref:uncharacterized protein LOC128667240 n=1 Tax=Microplitis demolitor TaxID=69319 RepID=UPI0004CCC470|nr:uncharacterized protein LOC128667240 [Microplitis demolitor]
MFVQVHSLSKILIITLIINEVSSACVQVNNDDMIEYSCENGSPNDLYSIPERTEKIRITNMDLSYITTDTFSRFADNLWVLSCSHCSIQEIDPDAFKTLRNLQQLRLDNNKLRSVKAEWFKGLNSLTYLDFNYNQIETIEDGVFDNLPGLVDLRIAGNKLQCVNVDEMSRLADLKRVFLNRNPEFKCPNAVDKLLQSKNIDYERDDVWEKLSHDLIQPTSSKLLSRLSESITQDPRVYERPEPVTEPPRIYEWPVEKTEPPRVYERPELVTEPPRIYERPEPVTEPPRIYEWPVEKTEPPRIYERPEPVTEPPRIYGRPEVVGEPPRVYEWPVEKTEPPRVYERPEPVTEPPRVYEWPVEKTEPPRIYERPEPVTEPPRIYGRPEVVGESPRFYERPEEETEPPRIYERPEPVTERPNIYERFDLITEPPINYETTPIYRERLIITYKPELPTTSNINYPVTMHYPPSVTYPDNSDTYRPSETLPTSLPTSIYSRPEASRNFPDMPTPPVLEPVPVPQEPYNEPYYPRSSTSDPYSAMWTYRLPTSTSKISWTSNSDDINTFDDIYFPGIETGPPSREDNDNIDINHPPHVSYPTRPFEEAIHEELKTVIPIDRPHSLENYQQVEEVPPVTIFTAEDSTNGGPVTTTTDKPLPNCSSSATVGISVAVFCFTVLNSIIRTI